MSSVLATAVASGRHVYSQSRVKEMVACWLNGSAKDSMLTAFDRALVQSRSSVVPIDYVFSERGLQESNDHYKRHASDLATQVVSECLDAAGWRAQDVDLMITTSCTGIMIPSVDAVVAERLQMKPTLKRLPITEHGCAGGAVALGLAHDHLRADPDHRVMVVSVELPSLTFQPTDHSSANVISSALFGDGAAAAALASASQPGKPRVLRTRSHRFPASLDWMGFELKDSGFHIVLSREVPIHIREHAPPVIHEFLKDHGLRIGDVQHFLLHPGGGKIIQAFEDALDVPEDALLISKHVLREHGNLSSATVLFILREFLERKIARCGDLGLLMAFGPGFGAEMLLLQWD